MVDALGDRMKRYENCFRYFLPFRQYTIIRVDGKAFHSYTREMPPFYEKLALLMDDVAIQLCVSVQNTVIAYVQSDEISLLCHPFKRLSSEGWFGNNLQKMVSISAAIASVEFSLHSGLLHGVDKPQDRVYFDSRAFILPGAEVNNYFLWRQQDATRNSLNTLCEQHFPSKELEGKNSVQRHDMLHSVGVNWNDMETYYKRGRCIVKHDKFGWIVDDEIPIFSQDRSYIERHLDVIEG